MTARTVPRESSGQVNGISTSAGKTCGTRSTGFSLNRNEQSMTSEIGDWHDTNTELLENPALPVFRLRVAFTMTPMWWLMEPMLGFSPLSRLLLLLVHESRWGCRKIKLTSALLKKARIEPRHRSRYTRQLEVGGYIHTSQKGQQAMVVTVLAQRLAHPP